MSSRWAEGSRACRPRMLRWSYRSLAIIRLFYHAVREVKPCRRGLAKHLVLKCQGPADCRPLSPARFINLSFCQLLGHNLRVWSSNLLDRPRRRSCHHSSGSFRDGRRRGLTRARSDLSQARPKSSKPHHAQLRTAVSGMGACASGT